MARWAVAAARRMARVCGRPSLPRAPAAWGGPVRAVPLVLAVRRPVAPVLQAGRVHRERLADPPPGALVRRVAPRLVVEAVPALLERAPQVVALVIRAQRALLG